LLAQLFVLYFQLSQLLLDIGIVLGRKSLGAANHQRGQNRAWRIGLAKIAFHLRSGGAQAVPRGKKGRLAFEKRQKWCIVA